MHKKVTLLLHNPARIIPSLASKRKLTWISDRNAIHIIFLGQMNHRLNLENPMTFDEKMPWLKLYDRNPLYAELVDKIMVRNYIRNWLG